MRLGYVAANWNESYATEEHLARDLEALGHDVLRLDERLNLRVMERKIKEHEARLVLYTKCYGLGLEGDDLWQALRAAGVPSASFHLDLYRGLDREPEIGVDSMWHTDVVFTADGDPETTAVCARRGIDHRWMPAAVVSDEATPGTFREEYAYGVVFVGKTGAYHRQWPWRQQLLAWLEGRYGDRFHAFGHIPKPIRDRDLNDLYASATVVVGDSLALPGHSFYWSDRFYETVGRGGFLVGPHVPGIDEHFIDYQHLRLYETGDFVTLGKIIDLYVSEPAWARRIADTGQAHVRALHTYRHRGQAILQEMGLA